MAAGWLGARGEVSLGEVHGSIPVVKGRATWRRALAFFGPGYLVAVGYMDPGNWATSLAGGSQFGYTLLVVALVSNIMAIMLQALCARLAVGSGPRPRPGLPRRLPPAGCAGRCGRSPNSPSSPPTSPR